MWMVVSAGSKRSRTVSVEANYDGQSRQEAKISGLVYTLCFIRHQEYFALTEMNSLSAILQVKKLISILSQTQ